MAAKKNAEEEVKNETETKNTPEKSLNALHKKVDAIGRFLETMFKFDIDGDGKIGCSRVGLLALTSAILFGAMGIVALAGEDIIATWPAQEGNAATVELWADNGDDTADKLQISMDEDGSAYFSIGGTDLFEINPALGAQAVSGVTSISGGNGIQYTVVSLDAISETATDGTAEGESQQILVFPEGRILILGGAIDATVTVNTNVFEASTADTFVTSIGTVAAADDAALTSTEADFIASTTHDTASGTTLTFAWEADFTSGADSVFDGTATAEDLYFNFGIPDANMSGDVTCVVSGTMTILWSMIGDD